MDFNLIKKCHKKVNLWTGVISFSFLIVGLIIIFSLPSLTIKVQTIVSLQFFLNNLFVWLVLVFINLSPVMVKIFFRLTHERNPKTQTVEKSELSLSPWTHALIFFFVSMVWLVEVSSFQIQTQTWILAVKNYWWVCLIGLVFNFCLLSLNFSLAKYWDNQQPEIQAQLKNN